MFAGLLACWLASFLASFLGVALGVAPGLRYTEHVTRAVRVAVPYGLAVSVESAFAWPRAVDESE